MVPELDLGCVLIAELTTVVRWKFFPWFRLCPLQPVTGVVSDIKHEFAWMPIVFLLCVRYHLTQERCGIALAGHRLHSLFLFCQQKSRYSFLLLL